jgi:hypothetical protein
MGCSHSSARRCRDRRFDGLDALVTDVPHPQGQSMIAQEQLIRIEINRHQRFADGFAKGAGKIRVSLKRRHVLRSDPKL